MHYVMTHYSVLFNNYISITVPTPSVSTSGNTVTAGQSTSISCTVTLDNHDKYSTDTSVNVMWTRGLPTKSYSLSNTVTDSRSLSAVNTSQAGTYTCTAQVVYTGS